MFENYWTTSWSGGRGFHGPWVKLDWAEHSLLERESDTDTEETKTIAKTKKRKSHERVTDVMKKMRLQSHELGPDFCCSRLKCFSEVSAEERSVNISYFNNLQSVNEQNSFLTSLINVVPVSRRRSRKPEEEAKNHDAAYAYKVHEVRDG
ncbi:hypothetical protein J6590_088423 [Homalodisca vitripennis]|nr:hypothetical protein J6590_088423 [Homalodisca vitripennis]